jgi:hypothetical protein
VAGPRLDTVVVHFCTQQLEKQGVIKVRTGFLTAAIKAGGGVRKELMFVALFTPCLLLSVKRDTPSSPQYSCIQKILRVIRTLMLLTFGQCIVGKGRFWC